jgi:hypothetical protein
VDRDVSALPAQRAAFKDAFSQGFASARGNLKLVDGLEFVGLIEKYYDGLDLKFRKQIPLRRMLVPDILQDN